MFDPFRDFETAGYLRNHQKEKDLDLVKELEHAMFRATVQEAISFLASVKTIEYSHFLKVHEILFRGVYPWAGQDRAQTAPTIAVIKGELQFCHPMGARRAVEYGLEIGQNKKLIADKLGEVMGLFAYGHPFLECNGRTMLVVHWELCFRAGFAVDWSQTSKNDYLGHLTDEICSPGKGILDGYLKKFVVKAQHREDWAASVGNLKGLDGRAVEQKEAGDYSDVEVSERYRQFERQRGYEIKTGG